MAKVVYKRGPKAGVDNIAIQDGQIIVTIDTGEIYIDVPNSENEIIRKQFLSGKSIEFKFVQFLPTIGEPNIIYFVPKPYPETGNGTDEYIYSNNTWEKIGDTKVDLTNYALKSELASVATTGDYDDLSNKPSIPSKTSDLTNNSGFITNADLTGYATETWVNARINTVKTSMDNIAVPGVKYFLGEQSTVSFTLPDTATAGQEIIISWYNGSTPATLTISEGTTPMLDLTYVPSANTRSELNCLWDGSYWSILGVEQGVSENAE